MIQVAKFLYCQYYLGLILKLLPLTTRKITEFDVFYYFLQQSAYLFTTLDMKRINAVIEEGKKKIEADGLDEIILPQDYPKSDPIIGKASNFPLLCSCFNELRR